MKQETVLKETADYRAVLLNADDDTVPVDPNNGIRYHYAVQNKQTDRVEHLSFALPTCYSVMEGLQDALTKMNESDQAEVPTLTTVK